MASDFDVCRDVFRRHSRTYYYSARFFPSTTRKYVCALYAFFRLPDELVDNPEADPERELARFRRMHDEVWWTGESDHPVLRAFHSTAIKFNIPREWPDSFLDSMAMDLTVARYDTYEDLRRYVYGSAEVVGLMMSRVLGAPDEGLDAARNLGLAMQLTNFYRDIGEDLERGRIYVPLEDLERFELRERDWHAGVPPEPFNRLILDQAERNLAIYRDAHAGLSYIPRKSRLAVALSSTGYQHTLHNVMRNPMAVWDRKVRRRKTEYLPILYKAWNAASDP